LPAFSALSAFKLKSNIPPLFANWLLGSLGNCLRFDGVETAVAAVALLEALFSALKKATTKAHLY